MKLRRFFCGILCAALLTGAAWGEVYVKNKPFEGKVSGSGSSTLVEAEAMLQALGVKAYRLEGQQLVVNETVLPLEGGLVSLQALTKAVGANLLINAELGTIDVYQDASKPALQAAAPTSATPGEIRGYSPSPKSPGVWLTDWEAASAESKRLNRPILINFTGSDWCGWCKRLKKEVFGTHEFKSWAGQNVILMEADFPRKKELPPELAAQNQALAQRLQISGYPSIIFIDPKGQQMGPRYGYREGGPQAWIQGAEEVMGR